MKKIVPVIAALLLMGGGCAMPTSAPSNEVAPTNAGTNTSSEAELKVALETTYVKMQTALVAKDFETFAKQFAKQDARLTKENFLESLELLNKVFKPLDKSKFITAYRKGDTAYMIRETYLNDPNFISVDGQIYNLKNGTWLIGEFANGDSVNKDKDHPENDAPAVQKAIDGIKKELEDYKPEAQQ